MLELQLHFTMIVGGYHDDTVENKRSLLLGQMPWIFYVLANQRARNNITTKTNIFSKSFNI